MAGKGYATVQLLEDQDDESDDELIVPPTTSKPAADNLLFQDFGHPIPLEDDNVATLTRPPYCHQICKIQMMMKMIRESYCQKTRKLHRFGHLNIINLFLT